MKNTDIVFNYIKNKVTTEYIFSCIKKGTICGVNANEIEENLNIVRNNASTILNKLWKSSKLIKINTRPVTFIPLSALENVYENSGTISNDTYSLEQLNDLIMNIKSKDISSDPFKHLIGSNDSLQNPIEQAKAAIVYPKKGLHTLILGESGVGKTTFAYAMHEFGKIKKNLSDNEFPFISFNCSDYFNNPQLLFSQLFGHAKGAFTGADSEKIGLVEKAHGGILFLDEIHRLPPDGQEMLFYLMDKGEFHRMGETGKKRKCDILIISATTETPDKNLLATFLRRIPVVITLPSFRDKSIGEKIEIIQNAFSYEAKNLNRSIRISPQVLKAISLYPFSTGNIGELRSEIKLLCAKSFLNNIDTQELFIEFKMLDNQIREYVLNSSNSSINKNDTGYLKMFSEDIIIYPLDKTQHNYDYPKKDIYDTIIKTLEELKEQCLSKEDINTKIRTLIENNFNSLMDDFNISTLNLNQLYKIVSKDITDYCSELIAFSENELSYKFNNKFIFGFSLHINALLKRINDKKPISNPDMAKIKNDYPEEFAVSKKLVKLLSKKYGVLIPEAEKGFLTILLANNKLDKTNDPKIKIFIICHGYSTATSIANVANTLLNSNLVKAIDMPLDSDISDTYYQFKKNALETNNDSSILLLVDMGSLIKFGDKLMEETGIKVRTIDNVSTLIVIEALRNVLYKNDDIDTLYDSLISKSNYNKLADNKSRKQVILTCCSTGKGASMVAKNILTKMLADEYKDKISILTRNYSFSHNEINILKKKYDIIAIIGSFNPNLDIPYFPINRLLDNNFKKEFLFFLEANTSITSNSNSDKSVYDISKEMLEEYVKYINPKFAIIIIKKFISLLDLANINDTQDQVVDLVIHLGCMIDRCIHGDFIKFDNINEYKEKNIIQFNKIRSAISILEKEYVISVSDDEVCYIIKIINNLIKV